MATLSRTMKKAASSVFPLATRRTPPYGNYTSGIRTTQLKTSTTSVRSIVTSSNTNLSSHSSRSTPVSAHYPTTVPANKESNSDDTLLRNIQSKIDRTEEKIKVPEAPKEFPFKIEDDEEERENIILTREYQDEQIKVTVCAGDYSRSVDLFYSVTKNSGSTLEFEVTIDESGGFGIDRWALMIPNDTHDKGPDFWDLDNGLQQSFYTYLKDRGIKPSITTFLCDYLVYKEEKEKYDNDYEEEEKNLLWWKKLKNFIEY